MKLKRLRLPLIVTALAAVLTVGAFAADEHSHCVCGGENTVGDHTAHQAVEWTAWTQTDALPTTAGEYYLVDDVTPAHDWEITQDIKLCLNGHNIAPNDAFWSSVTSGHLTITDCQGSGYANGLYVDSGALDVYNGGLRVQVANSSTINQYGGTLDFINSDSSTINMYGGTTVTAWLHNNSTFTMYDGQISGPYSGSSVDVNGSTFKQEGGTISNSNGGGISVTSGKVTIAGGLITNCTDSALVVADENSSAYINGGSITNCNSTYPIQSRGYLEMNGGEISNCGTIAVLAGSTFQFNNGKISNSTDTALSVIGTVNMAGGQISGCKSAAIAVHAGTLKMDGGLITNCDGSALVVFDENCSAYINGGSITNCNSAYSIQSRGYLEMNGGEISNCSSIAVIAGSTFQFNNGKISNSTGTALFVIGTVNMAGGQISGCKSAAIAVHAGTLKMDGGLITNCDGSALVVFDENCSAYINGGSITNCNSAYSIQSRGYLEMNGGEISNCSSIAVIAGSTFQFNNGKISNSTGTALFVIGTVNMTGGQINGCENGAVEVSSGDFNMNGGTIQNCSAEDSIVSINNGSTFAMTGGTIQNCVADSAIKLNGSMQVSGSPVISGNYDKKGRERSIYLCNTDSKIVVTGALGSDASLGVYCPDSKDSAIVGNNNYALTASDLQKFHSENLQLVLNPKTTNGKLEGWLEYRKATAFSDVGKDYWCYNAVNWAVENGITNGTTETTFGPTNGCTRAQMVTFLWRAAGMPHAKNSVNPFTDVSPNRYYYDAVLWAVEQGITNGATATTFEPDRLCTRGHIVTFLWRAAGKPSHSTAASPFTDVAKNAYCSDAVLWASENGITQGMTATTFAPNRTCTRAQGVTFLYRAKSYLQ